MQPSRYSSKIFQRAEGDGLELNNNDPEVTVSVSPADMSIFTLKEVQLQRDPGYRSSSHAESGESEKADTSISIWPFVIFFSI